MTKLTPKKPKKIGIKLNVLCCSIVITLVHLMAMILVVSSGFVIILN